MKDVIVILLYDQQNYALSTFWEASYVDVLPAGFTETDLVHQIWREW